MFQCSPFLVSLLVIGLFCAGFQVASIFVLSWKRMGIELKTGGSVTKTTYNMGLWSSTACVEVFDTEICVSIPLQSIVDAVETESDTDEDLDPLKYRLPLKLLTLNSGIWGVGGCMIILAYMFTKPSTKKTIQVAVAWIVCAASSLATVGLRIYTSSDEQPELTGSYRLQMYMEYYFPWAVVTCGIGGFLALVIFIALLASICCPSDRDPSYRMANAV